jgi:hypothetical protein
MNIKQYKLPAGHKKITNTIVKLKKVIIICPEHSTYISQFGWFRNQTKHYI